MSARPDIQVRKLPDGWQAFRMIDGKVVVLDGFFEYEDEANLDKA